MDKEAKRIYDKTYRKANKEKRAAQNKAWWKAHPAKVKTYGKARRKAYANEIRAYNKAYREANPEKVKARNTAYYENNKERFKAVTRVWTKANPEKRKAYRKANPEKIREAWRKYRALKRTTKIEPINEKIVFMRDGWVCQHCKKRADKRFKHPNPMCASLDHIIPLSEGGTHTYANVQLAHLGCNSSKGNNVLPQGEQLRLC